MMRPILVVEDDEDVRQSIIESLEDAGYRAIGANDGGAALQWLRTSPVTPAVILLDLMMPRVNGFQFRMEQVKDQTLAQIPVIVLSADTTTREKAGSVGATGFIRKPVKLDDLLAIAQRYVSEEREEAHG